MSKTAEERFFNAADLSTAKAKKDIVDSYTNWCHSESSQLAFYACVLVFYSHLEGSIKYLAERYLDFLKIKLNDVHLIPHLHYILTINSQEKVKWYKRISVKKSNEKHNSGTPIDTLNNLNYETFKQILFVVNVPEHNYSKFEKTLDEFVQKRNDIAHGNPSIYYDKLVLTYEDISKYKQLVIDIISLFKSDLSKIIDNKHYIES